MRLLPPLLAVALAAGCHAPCPEVPRGAPAPDHVTSRLDMETPPPKPPGAVRIAVGGDSRKSFPWEGPDAAPRDASACGDRTAALPWAFAAAQGAAAFLYLGDMEHTPPADDYFPRELSCLDEGVRFCPVFGNHEGLALGELPLLGAETARADFVRDYLLTPRRARHSGVAATCLGEARMPAEIAPARRVFYSVDLPGNVHFVALDNVSEDKGFGEEQLAWLARDLHGARARGMVILAGMHEALAGNGVTHHSMDEDAAGRSCRVEADAARALRLFQENGVALVLASHDHGFWELRQPAGGGIRSFITGGLGAPLDRGAGPCHAFFHMLLLDVVGREVGVTVVRMPGQAVCPG